MNTKNEIPEVDIEIDEKAGVIREVKPQKLARKKANERRSNAAIYTNLILISIILGGRIMGVAGILLAIPVAAILQFIADGAWKEYNFRRKLKEDGGTAEDIDLDMINKIFDIKDDRAAADPSENKNT